MDHDVSDSLILDSDEEEEEWDDALESKLPTGRCIADADLFSSNEVFNMVVLHRLPKLKTSLESLQS